MRYEDRLNEHPRERRHIYVDQFISMIAAFGGMAHAPLYRAVVAANRNEERRHAECEQ